MTPENNIAHALLALLQAQGFCPADPEEGNDVAWVGIHPQQLDSLPGEAFLCPVRGVHYKVIDGVEFRASPWAKFAREGADLRGHVAWNLTKRTKKLLVR